MDERAKSEIGDERTWNNLPTIENALASAKTKDGILFAVIRTRPANVTAAIRWRTVSFPLRGKPSQRSNDSYNGASKSRTRKHPNTICMIRRLLIGIVYIPGSTL